ncbi:hypothetical protein [Deinococcus sp.]|uniref:hypothetical protein n=1 Tax=Deinococcus sp. TaxID=47478 RepID=UPI003C7ADDA2
MKLPEEFHVYLEIKLIQAQPRGAGECGRRGCSDHEAMTGKSTFGREREQWLSWRSTVLF